MKNRILAMEAAPAAIPVKPKTAAIIATTRNMTVQRSIEKNLSEKIQFTVNRLTGLILVHALFYFTHLVPVFVYNL
jgi:hypothetical protein